jgi:hypothetical protein
MAIQKQEFYEGAALYRLIRTGVVCSIEYDQPTFLINGRLRIYLKYCTRVRSPWGFTFTAEEQWTLDEAAVNSPLVLGLVCAGDGIVAVTYAEYRELVPSCGVATRLACRRDHGEHYEVKGPESSLGRKVSPSRWLKILNGMDHA